jgi:hypothetical protein
MLPRLLVCLLLIPTPDVVKESPSAVKRVPPANAVGAWPRG